MISWLTWPVKWLARKLSDRPLDEIQRALGEAGYVDVNEFARLNRISQEQASEELEQGVKVGVLEKMFLYEGSDAPFTFVFPESLLETSIRLSQIGDISEDEDRELVVSSLRSRPVYVAAGEVANYVHAA